MPTDTKNDATNDRFQTTNHATRCCACGRPDPVIYDDTSETACCKAPYADRGTIAYTDALRVCRRKVFGG